MSRISDLIRAHNIGNAGHVGDITIVPENVTCRKNLQYGNDKEWNVFDIYYETSHLKGQPTLISIHGGGWVSNTKESYEPYCLDLAARGFHVVNFTFRLAPEHPHPAMIEDVNQLMVHLYEHQEDYQLDMENVFMVGDSAGAHLLAMYMGICTNDEYAKSFSFKVPQGFIPKGIALNCGVYDILYELEHDKSGMMKDLIYDYIGKHNRELAIKQINAIDYITSAFPPVYIMTSNKDIFQDQYEFMIEKIKQVEVTYICKKYGDENTSLGHVFHLDVDNKDAIQCNNDECAFFRSLQ